MELQRRGCIPQALALVVAVCAICVRARSVEQNLASQWAGAFDAAAFSNPHGPTPVQRVVQLLQEMKDQLNKEAEKDREAHDKAACWCDTNEKAKTKAIAEADAKITELLMEVESRSARGGELAVQIEQMKRELQAMKESLASSTSIRERDAAAFRDDEKESVQAITMLNNAVLVLGKHHAGLLQITPAVQESLGSALSWVSLKHEELLAISTEQSSLRGSRASGRAGSRRARSAASLLTMGGSGLNTASTADSVVFRALAGASSSAASPLPANFAAQVLAAAAASGTSFAQQPTGAKSYDSQSGEVLGILKQMKDEFQEHLTQAQQQEVKAVEDFQQLKAALDQQISSATTRLDEMEGEHASNAGALSLAKRTLESTRDTRSTDVQFLQDLKLQCQDLEADYNARNQARNDELQAVNGALVTLTEDDARDLFQKRLGPSSFFQIDLSGTTNRAMRSRAAALLLQAVKRIGQMPDEIYGVQVWRPSEDAPHTQLAAIAVQVQLDAFTKVKEAIDGMVADLKAQQQQEVDHKALCTQELNTNEKEVYAKQQVLTEVQDRIGALEATIEKLSSDIQASEEEIARMDVEIKKAGEIREKENKDFQEQVSDQRAMQQILKKAVDRLKAVFGKAALAQQEPEAPTKQAPRKQHRGGSTVVALIEEIISDSEKAEHQAVASEQEAQKVYETFVRNANASIKTLREGIVSAQGAKSAAEVDKSEAEAAERTTQGQLQALSDYATDLHAQCNFVLKNFDIRQKARLQEIEALGHAKAVLSGMTE